MIASRILLSSINVENEELINYIIEQKDQKISLMQGDISNLVTVFGVMIAVMAIVATIVILYISVTNAKVQSASRTVNEQLTNLKNEEMGIQEKSKRMDSMIKELEAKIKLINEELKTEKVIESLNYVNRTKDVIGRNNIENEVHVNLDLLRNTLRKCQKLITILTAKDIDIDTELLRELEYIQEDRDYLEEIVETELDAYTNNAVRDIAQDIKKLELRADGVLNDMRSKTNNEY